LALYRYIFVSFKKGKHMGLQDKLSAAKAALLRQYEQKSGEHIDDKDCNLSDEVLALVVDLDLSLAI